MASDLYFDLVLPAPLQFDLTAPAPLQFDLSAAQGPAGPKGDAGPANGADLSHRHDQMTASDTWDIEHNLGKFPSVTIVDSAGDEVEGAALYVDANNVRLSFSAPFAGTAHLN